MNDQQVITDEEVAALGAAREALNAIIDRNFGTMLQGSAIVAQSAVFAVLNHASSYMYADLTYEQLHGERVSR